MRPERPFIGVSWPSGPEIARKSQKESFWRFAKKSPKIPEKVLKYPKLDFSGYFLIFWGYFRALFCRHPKRLLFKCFAMSGPEARNVTHFLNVSRPIQARSNTSLTMRICRHGHASAFEDVFSFALLQHHVLQGHKHRATTLGKSCAPPQKPGPQSPTEPSKTPPPLRAQRLKKFKILKFSSEIENFKRATHQGPIFCGKLWRSRLKISIEIENFKRD